jgi:hypothetical protein
MMPQWRFRPYIAVYVNPTFIIRPSLVFLVKKDGFCESPHQAFMLSLQWIGRGRLRQMDVRRRIFFSTLGAADPSLVDARHAPTDYTDGCAIVYPYFVTPKESDLLSSDILARMKRYVLG